MKSTEKELQSHWFYILCFFSEKVTKNSQNM